MIFKTPRSTLLRGLKAMLAMQGCNYIVHFCQAGDYIVRLFIWGDRSELWRTRAWILETTKVQNSQNAVPRLYLTIVGPQSDPVP